MRHQLQLGLDGEAAVPQARQLQVALGQPRGALQEREDVLDRREDRQDREAGRLVDDPVELQLVVRRQRCRP
jgi:hypothetical protein